METPNVVQDIQNVKSMSERLDKCRTECYTSTIIAMTELCDWGGNVGKQEMKNTSQIWCRSAAQCCSLFYILLHRIIMTTLDGCKLGE